MKAWAAGRHLLGFRRDRRSRYKAALAYQAACVRTPWYFTHLWRNRNYAEREELLCHTLLELSSR